MSQVAVWWRLIYTFIYDIQHQYDRSFVIYCPAGFLLHYGIEYVFLLYKNWHLFFSHSSVMKTEFKRKPSFSGGITSVAVLLQWRYYFSGGITLVAVLLQWRYYFSGGITLVAVLLQWRYYFSGGITSVAVLLQWRYYFNGGITSVAVLL